MAERILKKRGAATQRRGLSSSTVSGITTAAIETGLAIATKHAASMLHAGELAYATAKDGDVIFQQLAPLSYPLLQQLSICPCVIGQIDRTYTFLTTQSSLSNALSLMTLYERPMEFQFIVQDGIGRFCLPYSLDLPTIKTALPQLIRETLNMPPYHHEQKTQRFFQSAEIVSTMLHGESYFVPWGVDQWVS